MSFRTLDRLVAPLIAVVADGHDDLVARNQLQRLLNVANEEWLTRHRPGFALRLVLVIVHKDESVGVIGEILVIEIVIVGGDVDVHLQSARVQVRDHLPDQRVECRLCRTGKVLKVDRDAPKLAVGSQKYKQLTPEIRASSVVTEEISDILQPLSAYWIEVIDQRK